MENLETYGENPISVCISNQKGQEVTCYTTLEL